MKTLHATVLMALCLQLPSHLTAQINIGPENFVYIGPDIAESATIVADPSNSATLYMGAYSFGLGTRTASIFEANIGYALLGRSGPLFKSENGGLSWRQLRIPTVVEMPYEILISEAVGTILVEPSNPRLLYAVAYGTATFRQADGKLKSERTINLFFSRDAGESWFRFYSVISPDQEGRRIKDYQNDVKFLRSFPAQDNPVLYFYTEGGLIRFTLRGENQISLDTLASPSAVANMIPKDLNSGRGGVAKLFFPEPANPANMVLQASGTYGFDTEESSWTGVYFTDDGGDTWIRTELGLPPNKYVADIHQDPVKPSVFYAIPSTQVGNNGYMSTDATLTWKSVEQLPDNIPPKVVVPPRRPPVLVAYGYSSFYKAELQTGAGLNNATVRQVRFMGTSGDSIIAVRDTWSSGNYLSVTSDGGKTWHHFNPDVDIPNRPSQYGELSQIPEEGNFDNQGTLWSARTTSDGVAILRNKNAGGFPWSERLPWEKHSEATFPSDRTISKFVLDPSSADVMYIIASKLEYIQYGEPGYKSGESRTRTVTSVFKTIDGGNNWTELDGSPTELLSLMVDPYNSSQLYGLDKKGLFISNRGGLTWSQPRELPAPIRSQRREKIEILDIP